MYTKYTIPQYPRVQKIYTLLRTIHCDHENMEGDERTCTQQPNIRFQLVSRKLNPAQAEAGKRLFKRLVARAQSSIQTSNESKQVEKRK